MSTPDQTPMPEPGGRGGHPWGPATEPQQNGQGFPAGQNQGPYGQPGGYPGPGQGSQADQYPTQWSGGQYDSGHQYPAQQPQGQYVSAGQGQFAPADQHGFQQSYNGGQYPPHDAGSTAPRGLLGAVRARRRRRGGVLGGVLGAVVAIGVVLLKVVGASLLVGALHGAPKLPEELAGAKHLTSSRAQQYEQDQLTQLKKDNPRGKVADRVYYSNGLAIEAMGFNAGLDDSDSQWRNAHVDPDAVKKVGHNQCGVASDKTVVCQRSSWRKSAAIVVARPGQSGDVNAASKILDELWSKM